MSKILCRTDQGVVIPSTRITGDTGRHTGIFKIMHSCFRLGRQGTLGTIVMGRFEKKEIVLAEGRITSIGETSIGNQGSVRRVSTVIVARRCGTVDKVRTRGTANVTGDTDGIKVMKAVFHLLPIPIV